MTFVLIAPAVLLLIATMQQTTATVEIAGSLGQCLQKIEPRVCDPQNVLAETERSKLDALLVRVEEGTKREGYPLRIRAKDCGSHGIIMPLIQLKLTSEDMDTVQTQLNDLLQEYTDAHPCMRIAFLVLNADAEKIENRRFWVGVNWNVNVVPKEIVELYRNEIPLVIKAEYGQALNNIAEKFLKMANNRLNVPFAEAQIFNANNNTRQSLDSGTQQNTVSVEKSEPKTEQPQNAGTESN